MPRNSERIRPHRADVRAQVLTAARDVFAEAGYHGASLDTIAARAGFSKGAVYSNFAGKDDLFLALVEDELAVRADQLAATTGTAPATTPGSDDVLNAVAAGVLALAIDGATANLVFAEFRAHAHRDAGLAARLGALRERLTDLVAARLAAESARLGWALAVPAREGAATLLAVINGLALEQIGRTDTIVSVDTLAAVLRGFVRPA